MSDNFPSFEKDEKENIDLETLEGLEPLSSLSDSRLRELARETYVEYLEPMKCLFVEGDQDGEMIFLINGEVELRSGSSADTVRLSAGMPECGLPLANRQPRQETAITVSHVEIIRIDLDKFDQMLTWDQMAKANDKTDGEKITVEGMGEGWRSKLKNNLTLNNVPPANIEELFKKMEPVEVSAGDVVIKQGDPGDYFYLIDKGRARVVRIIKEGVMPVELAELGPGVSFGEEALISDKPRNANVSMISDGRLYRLAKRDFDELLKAPLQEYIELDEALRRQEKGARFLDVRVPSEYRQGHLSGSINIPLNELRQRLSEIDRDIEYICYCNTGRRSSAATFILGQQGMKACTLNRGVQSVPNTFFEL